MNVKDVIPYGGDRSRYIGLKVQSPPRYLVSCHVTYLPPFLKNIAAIICLPGTSIFSVYVIKRRKRINLSTK